MALQRVSHIGICVSDLERALAFYRDLLGFAEASSSDYSGPIVDKLLGLEGTQLRAIWLERDGTRIELLHFASPTGSGQNVPRPMNRFGFTHLSMRVDDLDATVTVLREAGVTVLDDTRFDYPEAEAAAVFVLDPDGTRVELFQAPGDPTAPPGS